MTSSGTTRMKAGRLRQRGCRGRGFGLRLVGRELFAERPGGRCVQVDAGHF